MKIKPRIVLGIGSVIVSLGLLRFFQLSNATLFWVALMGVGVVMFVVGSKLVLEGVSLFRGYRNMWPVFGLAMAIAWLIHAAQVETYADQLWVR